MASTDEELVARSRTGDLESFNQLVLRWERPIYALAYRTIGREEDARDVCQETFLRAFRALGGFKGEAKFSSWLYRITLNLCRDWIRRERRQPVAQAPEGVDLIELAGESTPSESVAGRAAHRDPLEGVSRAHVSGDCGHAGLSVEYREDAVVSGVERASSSARALRRLGWV